MEINVRDVLAEASAKAGGGHRGFVNGADGAGEMVRGRRTSSRADDRHHFSPGRRRGNVPSLFVWTCSCIM